MLVCLVLLVIDLGLMLPTVSRYSTFYQPPLSRNQPSSLLPFREKFFKVLIFEDSMQRYHAAFDQGLQDAASVFRQANCCLFQI